MNADTTVIRAAMFANLERTRLAECTASKPAWKFWGPYLSERQWGTVREDYSPHGNAWEYFPHEQARSRAYRWGEDGLMGFSDNQQRLCISMALWNGRDPILKERLYGLTNSEGNHGEDVKELYYYLEATPAHSYLKMLYKYPQCEFPYSDLLHENRRRGNQAAEYELLDTGAFADNRYFDVFVEYAQAEPEDILMRVTVHNRGPEAAELHALPQLCFRNTWSWKADQPKPQLRLEGGHVVAEHAELGRYHCYVEGDATWLFTENDTNLPRLYGSDAPGPFKDGFHDRVIHGAQLAVSAQHSGTKAAAWHRLQVPAQSSVTLSLRLSRRPLATPFAQFEQLLDARRREADDFYAVMQHDMHDADARMVQRQAFAGMIWSKQYFYFDIPEWLKGDPAQPAPPANRRQGRNREWAHLNNADIISMPDKWEYPWYAAWDLAFHTIALALVDSGFAKEQLQLLTREWYMHPNGQIPAYEWAFGDINPPVHAWATWRVFQMDRKQHGG
ncbi:MAG: hypothetical protein WCD08_00270 [Steroidobacteraceae bacterium]